jgi:hypothetical protein
MRSRSKAFAAIRHRTRDRSNIDVLITLEEVQRNLPKAVQWVTQMQHTCMEIGEPLLPQNRRDAETIGIQELAL